MRTRANLLRASRFRPLTFRRAPSAVVLAAALLAAAPARAADDPFTKVITVEGVTEYRLANGLRVLLVPDPSKPLVTINNTILVGSRHEGYGETGMAHLLEHMLFLGTPTYPEVRKALRDHGAGSRSNATTSQDRTNYFETMPAGDENLEFGIRLEADRMVNSYIRRDDLIREMTVVRNEFEKFENAPGVVLSYRMNAAAFEWHNYGKSVLGNRSDIERVPIESLQAFYHKYYRVDNAVFIVAGDFDPAKALAYITKYFGPLKRPALPIPSTYTEEPTQDGERTVTLRRVGTGGLAAVQYHIPTAAHADYAPLQILSDCLAEGPASRLHKSLVEGKTATEVAASVFGGHDAGYLRVVAAVDGPNGIEAARSGIVRDLDQLADRPFSAAEVDRIKQMFRSAYDVAMADSQTVAGALSDWTGRGDWRLFFIHRDRIEKATAADVNRVATVYLKRDNRTIGVYSPTAETERAAIPATPSVADMVAGYTGRKAVATVAAFDPTPANIEKRMLCGTLGGVKTAYLNKPTRGGYVTLSLALRYGTSDSLRGKNMAAVMMAEMLLKGSRRHTCVQIDDEAHKLGCSIAIHGDVGTVFVDVVAKKETLPTVLALVSEILREPTFPEAEFDKLKRAKCADLEAAKSEPQFQGTIALARQLWDFPTDDVRYEPTADECISRVEGTTLAQVKALYSEQLSAAAGEMAVVGEADPAAIDAGLGKALNGWTSAVPYKRIERAAQLKSAGRTIVIRTPDKANAYYLAALTYPMTDSDPDYAAIQVGNHILGAVPTSRLFSHVRTQKGLSYGIDTSFDADEQDARSSWEIGALTNPVNMDQVTRLIAEDVDHFLKDGVTPEEVEAAKKAILQDRQSVAGDESTIAYRLRWSLRLGQPYTKVAERDAEYRAVTPADVMRACRKVIDPKKLTIVQAGDFPVKK
jgi:zinc protease